MGHGRRNVAYIATDLYKEELTDLYSGLYYHVQLWNKKVNIDNMYM